MIAGIQRRIGHLALVTVVGAASFVACGPPPKPAELKQLETYRKSPDNERIRIPGEENEHPRLAEFRALALETVGRSDAFYRRAIESWESDDMQRAELFSRLGIIYFVAAKNYADTLEGQGRLNDASRRYQEQLDRRNVYFEQIEGETELVTLLETIQELMDRNEQLRQQLATIEEKQKVESRALYSIQEARVEQRTAEGMNAGEYARTEYKEAERLLARAQTYYQDQDFEKAYDTALSAIDGFKTAQEASKSQFLTDRERLMKDSRNQAIYDEALSAFPDAVRIDARGMIVTLADSFEGKETEGRKDRYDAFDKVVDLAKKYENYTVLIEGHTDDSGDANRNRTISESRATWLQDYMLKRNIKGRRVKTAGIGEDAPAFDNRDRGERRKNNRVEVIFLFQ